MTFLQDYALINYGATVQFVTIAYQMMTTNGKTGSTRGKWDSAKGKDSGVTAKPRQS